MSSTPQRFASSTPSRVLHAYLRSRFPDATFAAGDYHDPAFVIAGARRCLAGGHTEGALRLLELAIGERPQEESLWLARLDILGHAGDRARFLAVVRDYLEEHPDSPRFHEVVRIWKRFSPS